MNDEIKTAVALGGVAGLEAAVDRTLPPGTEHHLRAVMSGAECWRCPLLGCGRGPVYPTIPDEPHPIDTLVVAEAPGGTEVAQGEPLIGASGKELRGALQNAGAYMPTVGYSNAMMCMPEGGNLKNYLRRVKKDGQASPIDCCRPRLQGELRRARYVLLMGSASLMAVGLKPAVMTWRGTPLQIQDGPPALATPHAAFVMRDEGRTFRPIFHADVRKAVRISRGGNTWKDPAYFVPKNATEIYNFLAVQRPRVAVDVETNGVDQWTCGLRRIGIGTDQEVMVYSPLSVHGHELMPRHEIDASTRVIGGYFQQQPRMDFHNGVAFDSVVLWRHGMTVPDGQMFDTLVGHQIGNTSELPHALDFLGSVYTDAPRWKDDVKHSNVKDDAILDKYLSYDIAVTYASAPYVEANLVNAQQVSIYSLDMELFRIGRSMAMLGVYIDPQKRFEFAQEYQDKSDRLRAEFIETAGRDINPASYPQIRKLLYEDLGLPVLEERMTDSDEPSTDESTLLDLLGKGVDQRAQRIIHALLGYREAEKLLGTNLGHVVNGQLVGGPPVHADGRLRTNWRPGKRSGRWGSSDPVNMQNIPKKLRAMYRPAPGNVFVAADASAQELRLIALLSEDEPLIKAFADFDAGIGPDVHIFNACTVFKCRPEEVTDEVRNFIKRFVYALNYDAGPPRIYQTLSLLRDDNLRPLFPTVTPSEIERLYTLWWQLHPAIPAWKKKLIYGWRAHNYIETPYHKRKRFFIGGEKAEEMGNHPIQGGGADMQNDAIKALVRLYPFDFERHHGLVVNGHDQLVVECAKEQAEDVKRILGQVMQRKIGPMLFPAKPAAGDNWKAVS